MKNDLKILINFLEIIEKNIKNCRIQFKQNYLIRTKNGKFKIPVTRYYDSESGKTFNCLYQTNFISSKIKELKELCHQLFLANLTQVKISTLTKNSYTSTGIGLFIKKKSNFS